MLRGKGWRIHFFDEMTGQGGEVRSPYREYSDWFGREDAARIQRKTQQAEAFFRTTGITFNVYGEDEADERLIPFDVVQIGRAHVSTPVTNAHIVCRLLLVKK